MLKQYPDSMYQEKCPTQVYLEGVGQVKLWTGFDFYDKNPIQLIENVKGSYTLKERLTLGLPISYDEGYNTESWLHSTNKFSV